MSITVTKHHMYLQNGINSYDKDSETASSPVYDLLLQFWPRVTSVATYRDCYYLLYTSDSGSTFDNTPLGIGSKYSSTFEMDYITTTNTLFYNWKSNNTGGRGIITKNSDGSYIGIDLTKEITDVANSGGYVYSYDKKVFANYSSDSALRKDFLTTTSFHTVAPEGYVSLCPLINGSGEWSEKGAPTELSLVSGIDNASWDMNGIRVGNKTLFGYDGICIAADVVVDGGTINTSEAS